MKITRYTEEKRGGKKRGGPEKQFVWPTLAYIESFVHNVYVGKL